MRDEQRPASFGDYLHALAFRVLHEERVLQPRHASLFETDQPAAEEYRKPVRLEISALLHTTPAVPSAMETGSRQIALPTTPAAPSSNVAAEAVPPKVRSAPQIDSRIVPRDAQPAMREPEGTGSQASGLPTPRIELRTSIEVVRTAIARERSRVVPEPAPLAATPSRVAQRPVGGRLLTSPVPQAVRRAQPQSPDGLEVPTRAAPPAREILQIIRTSEKAVPAPASQPRQRMEPLPNHAVLMARVAPETQLLTPLFTPGPRVPQEETTVEITIGRLEIRTANTPPASQRTPARQPEVSLKEYLSRNAGGRS